MNAVTCVLLLGTGFLLLPSAHAQCINVTLPNVLGLGSCIGTRLQACPDTSDGLFPDLTALLVCVVQVLPEAGNPAAVLFHVAGLLETVLGRLGIAADITSISNLLCRPFGFQLLPCENFTSGTLVCGEPITVSLPSVFNIGSCLNRTALFCEAGQAVRDPILTELVEAIGCIVSGAPRTMGLSLAKALVCPLVEILKSATREFAAALPFGFIFGAMARVIRALTDRLVSSVVSC
uniref:Secreted protein n=1 Tax=Ixodes ricinus TaxID=34613 RepID=A0A147BUN9_IXORI